MAQQHIGQLLNFFSKSAGYSNLFEYPAAWANVSVLYYYPALLAMLQKVDKFFFFR
jgi:hypothetical protein